MFQSLQLQLLLKLQLQLILQLLLQVCNIFLHLYKHNSSASSLLGSLWDRDVLVPIPD
jgi:hypothetical protein